MYKCKVCGKEFELMRENHYVSVSRTPTGLSAIFSSNTIQYDTFDCTFCGCQNRMQERYEKYENTLAGMAVDEEEEDVNEKVQEAGDSLCEGIKKALEEEATKETKDEGQELPGCFGWYFGYSGTGASYCEDCKHADDCFDNSCLEDKVPRCFGGFYEKGHISSEESCKQFDDKDVLRCIWRHQCKRLHEDMKPECFINKYKENDAACKSCIIKKLCEAKNEQKQELLSAIEKAPTVIFNNATVVLENKEENDEEQQEEQEEKAPKMRSVPKREKQKQEGLDLEKYYTKEVIEGATKANIKPPNCLEHYLGENCVPDKCALSVECCEKTLIRKRAEEREASKKKTCCFGKFKNDDECENCEFNLDCIDSTKDLKYPRCFGGYKGWCEEQNEKGELRCAFRKVCERKIKESKEYRDCFGEYSVDDDECDDCKYKGECEQTTSSRERRKKWWK